MVGYKSSQLARVREGQIWWGSGPSEGSTAAVRRRPAPEPPATPSNPDVNDGLLNRYRWVPMATRFLSSNENYGERMRYDAPRTAVGLRCRSEDRESAFGYGR